MDGVEKKRINEAVSRNLKKFSLRFSFELNEKEVLNLKSQIATSSSWGDSRKGYRVSTEQGVAMLVSKLKTNVVEDDINKIFDN